MDNAFLKSLFVQPPEVIGRQLRPLSAWHIAALMILDSPFAKARAVVTSADLVIAVWVCSLRFEDGAAQLFPSPPEDVITEWGRDFDFESELAAFQLYLDDYLDLPGVWMPDGGGRESGIPSPFHCVATVLCHMHGITEARAWDMPFNLLVSYKSAIAEESGWEVVNERQQGLLALADELNRKAAEAVKDG